MRGGHGLTAAALGELVRSLGAQPTPSDLDTWGAVQPVDELGFVRIEPVHRWPGVTGIRLRPWTPDHPGECYLELDPQIQVPVLDDRFEPIRDAVTSPGARGPRLRSTAPLADLPARASVYFELVRATGLVRALTIVTENMERYR